MSSSKVLIVDDSDFDRGLLVKALARIGKYSIVEANNGKKCLDLLEAEKLGIILLDIMMPDTTGVEVLKEIRKKHNAIELPVIMITSKSETADVIECLNEGANDYITKPVNFSVAVSRIATHLRLAELSHEMANLKQVAALDSIIATYNHEINNPLSIAIGCLNFADLNIPANKEKLSAALWRVADIVKKIREVADKREIEFQQYSGTGKMVKVR